MNETEPTTKDNASGEERPSDANRSANSGRTDSKKATKRAKRAPIESFAQLVRSTYGTATGIRRLPKSDVRALQSDLSKPAPSDAEREALLELAGADITLDKTKQLMLLSARIDAYKVADRLSQFGRTVLARHALFQRKTMADVLADPNSIPVDSAVRTLVSTDLSSSTAEGALRLSKRQIEQCRTNAVHCLLLLLRATQRTPLERIQRYLQTHVWAPKTQRHQSEIAKLEILLTTRDTKAASVTFSLLEGQAREHERRAETAKRAEERARFEATDLEQQVATLERRLDETTRQRDQVHQQLDEARQAHATKEAHWRDSYERLRGQALRRLSEESSLLENGLDALRRDPPKVDVMIDHAERAIEGLKRTAERIRKETLE